MNENSDRQEKLNAFLKMQKDLEKLKKEVYELSRKAEESSLERINTRLASAEASLSQLTPDSVRMDNAAITKYIINTTRQEVTKQLSSSEGTSGDTSETDSLGGGAGSGGSSDSTVERLGATSLFNSRGE